MSQSLSVAVDAGHDRVIVIATVEIDVDSVRELDRTLGGMDSPTVVIDLGGITFCDSRGLECLIRNKIAFQENGRRLELARCSDVMDRLLTLTQTRRFFDGD